ncbi:hypothetical protein HGO21_00425 [Acinetobacter sp. CUI P1]|jgi:hypothetical protein|nr:hypothetical protein [Acinetobacter sp. CUI P1]
MLNDFLQHLSDVFGRALIIEDNDDKVTVTYMSQNFVLNKEEIEKKLERINECKVQDEDVLFSEQFYEVMVEESGPILRQDTKLSDERNKLEYKLGTPSDEFLMFMIYKIAVSGEGIKRRFLWSMRLPETNPSDFFEFLKFSLRRVKTLRITSDEIRKFDDFNVFADSITFEIAFNTGFSMTQVKNLEEFSIPKRVGRRNKIDDCEAPKRKYNRDLIYHYQLGVSTYHPALKFISFYHVLEHFFNIVYLDNMSTRIKKIVTRPDFSPKRDEDIHKLISSIRNGFRIEADSNTAKNEIESLKLVLKKYVDVDSLKNALNEYDSQLVQYYSKTKVSFSQGEIINFNDIKSVYGSLANRIYKTRNAVIHSKAFEKERYVPFEHENQLLKEIPLILFVAEEIILATSEII